MPESHQQKVLVIDDESDVHYSFKRLFNKEPWKILTADNGADGLRTVKDQKPDIVLLDIRMGKESGLDTLREIRRVSPKQLVIMMTAYGTSQTAIEAMKLGAFDYVLKPFEIEHLKALIRKALEAASAMSVVVELPSPQVAEDSMNSIVGSSPAMQEVYKLVGQVAPTEATVLITGESGTGKELIARAIYSNSSRSQRSYLAINCAAIPENLLESELFGHEKGSFTGATSQRIGKFEQSDGGTLFLDEIGEMPISLQTKILRVLQDGEFFRVGGSESVKTDVRIIAATNRDLWTAVQKREFREDLYYRLNVVSIQVPPLRDRVDDIPRLISFFINRYRSRRKDSPTRVSPELMERLKSHRWPGNVRELENVIQRAMVLATGDTLSLANISSEIVASTPVAPAPVETSPSSEADTSSGGSPQSQTSNGVEEALQKLFSHARVDSKFRLLPAVERELIVYALEQTSGNQVQAAKLLGITRATLRKRVEKFGISKKMKIDVAS